MKAAPPQDDWDQHWLHYAASASANPAERMRFELVTRLLRLPGPGVRLLDVGSGQGDLLAGLLHENTDIQAVGLELSRSGVQISRSKVPAARFIERDLLAQDELDNDLRNWATHATCSEVLEHVDDPVTLLRSAAAYMAPGCRLVVTVPGGPMSAFDRHLGHRGHFTPRRLQSVLEDAGFRVDHVGGAGFPFFNLYRLVVVARGRRLITDAGSDSGGELAGTARLVTSAFRMLFRLNLPVSPLGWQILGVARLPETAPAP